MKCVKCNEEVINNLLREINDTEWGCVEIDGIKHNGSSLEYRRAQPGDGVWGGMGGGVILDGKPWEERIEKQVIQEYRFPKDKKPLVVDILRAVVEEKIEDDKKKLKIDQEGEPA